MNAATEDWIALGSTILMLVGYEALLHRRSRAHPPQISRSAHMLLRRQWVQALSTQPGSEILAVQALRNSLMSSTITASTAAIMLMGCMTLAASSGTALMRPLLQGALDGGLKLPLMLATLFATYVCSAMSMRYFNHAGFVMSLPVGSDTRQHYEPMCLEYVRRGGVLYGWGLRCFLFIAPLITGLIMPLLMPVTALMLMALLRIFDQAGPTAAA
ncbi:MAG: DUF599 domain-containing protein [Aquabacterium sp.]